jgi:ABC-2 type transport system permease protein
VTAVQLSLVHTRFQFLETIRIPIAVIGNWLFPPLVLLFFVVPIEALRIDPVGSTTAVAQIAVFAAMSTCLFTFGVGVAEDRALPWDGYVRTLPAGPGPRFAGRLLNGAAFVLLGLIPLLVVAGLFTAATATPLQFLGGVGVLLAGAAPFLFAGLAIGYLLPVKAALAAAQVLLFPLAFGGGLFLPPDSFPAWLNSISQVLPTRGVRDLLVTVLTGTPPSAVALTALTGWTVVLAALAAWAYRRDEGRRFR